VASEKEFKMLTNTTSKPKPVLWQRLMHLGNQCFEEECFVQAEYYYKEAESYLDSLWFEDPSSVNLLTAWIGVLHNLASLCEQQGQCHIALQYLLTPHHRVIHLTQNKNTSEEVKMIAINALELTFAPILAFTKKHSMCDACTQKLKYFQINLDTYKNILH